jgi:peptidoglycan/LPS O-acetylase OafA/YrhL/peroxiredoxin
VADATAPAKRVKYPRYPELDALRALAAVSIVALHAYQNSRGPTSGYAFGSNVVAQHLLINLDYGLGVFFALSGFVVFLPFARAIIEGRQHIGVKEYAIRRLFRIVPLYYVAIFVVWDSRFYGGPGQIADLVRHLTFTQVYNNGKIFYTIGPSWSLAVEMHFYVLTGFLIWGLTKLCRRVSSRGWRICLLCAPLVLVAVTSIAFKAWAWYGEHYGLDNFAGPKHYTIYYSALARADAFVFGMLLSVIVVVIGKWRPRGPWLPRLLALGGLATWFAMIPFRADRLDDSNFVDLFYYTFIGLGTAMVMAAIVLSNPDWRWMKILRSRPLQYLGMISFSLYLWHEPVMLWLEKHGLLVFKGDPAIWPLSCLATITVSIAVGSLSYRLVEAPGERLRKLLRIRRPPAAPVNRPAGELQLTAGTELSALPALRDETGAALDLRIFAAGRPMVAFVQPRQEDADQAECIAEARAFRDGHFLFDALGVTVVGVSAQPPTVQRHTREREGLPFPMLSDPDCSFASALGLPLWRDKDGALFPERVALVVDARGTIRALLGADIKPAARAAAAAARSEALLT